jgi:hypothetical protein
MKAPLPSLLKDTLGSSGKMKADGRVDFRPLQPGEEGVFEWDRNSSDAGHISVNSDVRRLAAIVGYPMAFAVVVHESAHALAHGRNMLFPNHVIDGEVFAFKAQYQYLKLIDPTEERIPAMREALRQAMEKSPSPALDDAYHYMTSLDVLLGTEGNEGRIADYVRWLGYEETAQERKSSLPSA